MKQFKSSILHSYFICGTQDLSAHQTLPQLVEEALKAGITAYQFCDKGPQSTLSKKDRLSMAIQLHELCQKYHVPFFVDDDVTLAKEVRAEGIHVGQTDEAIAQVIADVGQQMIIGYSCSTLSEIEQGNQINGIDYYGCGPIFATQSKNDADPEIGLNGLQQLVTHSLRPIVAIGGITTYDLPAIAQTSAAVISMIAQSKDIQKTVTAMLNANWQY